MAAHAESFGRGFGVLFSVCLVFFCLLSFGCGGVFFFWLWCCLVLLFLLFCFFWLWFLDLSTWAGDP